MGGVVEHSLLLTMAMVYVAVDVGDVVEHLLQLTMAMVYVAVVRG